MRTTQDLTRALPILLALALAPACGGGDDDPQAPKEQSATLEGADGEALEVSREAPGEIRVGEEFVYRVSVRNASDRALQGVVLRDQPPEGIELVDATLTSGGEERPGAAREALARLGDRGQPIEADAPREQAAADGLRFEIGELAPDEEVVVEVTGVAHREGELEACALVSYDAPVCATWKIVAPELAAELRIGDGPFWICDGVPVTFHVANRGTGTIGRGQIRAQLPEGLRTEDGEAVLALEFEELEAGEETLEETTLRPARGGQFDLRAVASAGELSAQSRSERFQVLDPRVELTVGELGEVRLGDIARVEVRVMNTGDAAVENLVVAIEDEDDVEEAALFSVGGEGAEGADEFEIGRLEPGETRVLELRLRAEDDEDEIGLAVVARGRCLSREGEELRRELRAQVSGVAAVRLEVVDQTDPVTVGETTTYRVEVKNQGTDDDMGVLVAIELPPELELVGGEGETAVEAGEGGRVRLGPVDRLGAGESAEWQVEARAVAAGEVLVKLVLESEATRGAVMEEEPTTIVE